MYSVYIAAVNVLNFKLLSVVAIQKKTSPNESEKRIPASLDGSEKAFNTFQEGCQQGHRS